MKKVIIFILLALLVYVVCQGEHVVRMVLGMLGISIFLISTVGSAVVSWRFSDIFYNRPKGDIRKIVQL
jgi:hypothetical protein